MILSNVGNLLSEDSSQTNNSNSSSSFEYSKKKPKKSQILSKIDQSFPVYYKFSKECKQYIKKIDKLCEICNKSFKDQYVLKIHLLKKHNMKPNMCSGCEESFESIKDLKIHIERVHLNIYNDTKFQKSNTLDFKKKTRRKKRKFTDPREKGGRPPKYSVQMEENNAENQENQQDLEQKCVKVQDIVAKKAQIFETFQLNSTIPIQSQRKENNGEEYNQPAQQCQIQNYEYTNQNNYISNNNKINVNLNELETMGGIKQFQSEKIQQSVFDINTQLQQKSCNYKVLPQNGQVYSQKYPEMVQNQQQNLNLNQEEEEQQQQSHKNSLDFNDFFSSQQDDQYECGILEQQDKAINNSIRNVKKSKFKSCNYKVLDQNNDNNNNIEQQQQQQINDLSFLYEDSPKIHQYKNDNEENFNYQQQQQQQQNQEQEIQKQDQRSCNYKYLQEQNEYNNTNNIQIDQSNNQQQQQQYYENITDTNNPDNNNRQQLLNFAEIFNIDLNF